MNGAGVVATPPKPAPKPLGKPPPKPLAKPPLPRRSTSDGLPITAEKPTTSPKPPAPAIAKKPKPAVQVPVVSPKPPPPAVSSRPRSISAGSVPSPPAVPVPAVTNGGTPPPPVASKPKPLVKRKSWIAFPQQAHDVTGPTDAIPEETNTPASEELVCEAPEASSEDNKWKEKQECVNSESIDYNSSSAEESRDKSGDADSNQIGLSSGDILRNSDEASLQSHAINKEQGHCEISESISLNHTAASATISEVPIPPSEDKIEKGEDFYESTLLNENESIQNDTSPAEDVLETTNFPIAEARESSASDTSGVSSEPDTNILPDCESPATAQDSPSDLSSLAPTAEATANPTPSSEPEKDNGATDLGVTSDDDDDDAFEETEDSTGKGESVEHPKPPTPAPRTSLSSTTSDVSSLDSYDFLNRSRGGSSFKSQRSSYSVRSQGSSCLGSDSEDESGVFEVQQEIPEEDEETEEVEGLAESTDPDDKDSSKRQSSLGFAELQEKEGHIAESDQDIVLVSASTDIESNSAVAECVKSKESDQVISEQEHSSAQESTGEQSESISADTGCHVDDHLDLHRDPDIQENTEDNQSKAEISVNESKISDKFESVAGDVTLSNSEKSDLQLSESCQEIQEREEVKGEIGQAVTEEGEEDREEEEEGEEEFDEMGKRVFSFSRKKKPGVLKYSPGEFHEQYEASGKEKAAPESKDPKKKPKKEPKKGKKDVTEEKLVIEDVHIEQDQGATSDEDRPTKPPRMRPGATPEELEVGRASTTSDISTSPLEGQNMCTVPPLPAPRVSLSNPSSRPRISLSHRVMSLELQSDSDEDTEAASSATDDAFIEEHAINGGAGAVVTHVDSDGEEEVFIGGMPSSSMCTQTAFADQASITSSADDLTEVNAVQQGGNNDQQFRHFATIEPVGDAAQRKDSPSVEVTADGSNLVSAPIDTLTTLSENQSVTISITGSEPLSDSAEFLSQHSEHALNKPWSEVAAVTVAVTSMPEPLVPEFTRVEGDSSTTSSSSSLVPGQPNAQENISLDSSRDGEDDDDDDDDDDNRNMYDKIDIYDESFKKKDWKYRETDEELRMITQPDPENAEEAAEAKDTISHLSESSLATTASEQEFKSIFGERPHRIQRRRGSEDFVRLSRISRERTIYLHRQDGTYGLRIQKSKPVIITSLDPGGPAENAGLKAGDMVLKINGQDVRQVRHSEVVKLATEAPEPLVLVVGTVVCNSLNQRGDHTIMSGYMHKLASTGVIKQWRRRWFVLKHDNCLYYYKTESDILPQGAIVLQNYTVTKARDAGKQFSFKLTKEGARTYFFYTANEEERGSWGKAINDAANPNHKTDVWLDISTHNVSLPALSIKDPECTGFLTKWNGKMKNPRRRYCVVKDACLYYYKEMDALDAQGVVHLHGYSIQETELKGKKFAFTLTPPDKELREFYFFADHDTDRKRWVAALASSIGRWIQTNNTDEGEDDGTEMLI